MLITQQPDVTASSCAAALGPTAFGAHYLPGVTSYVFDYHDTIATQEERIAGIHDLRGKDDKSEIKYGVRLSSLRVEHVSPSSAIYYLA